MQLWVRGLHHVYNSGSTASREAFQNDFSNYGVDFEGPVPAQESENVEVPETICPIELEGADAMAQFSAREDMSIREIVDLYVNAVHFAISLHDESANAE